MDNAFILTRHFRKIYLSIRYIPCLVVFPFIVHSNSNTSQWFYGLDNDRRVYFDTFNWTY